MEEQYCEACGSKMVVIGEQNHSTFEKSTGRKIVVTVYRLKCPNKKKWWDEHEEYDDTEVSTENVEN